MLKCRIDENETMVEAQGNVVEITTEVCMLIKVIHNKLNKEKAQEFFASSVKDFMDKKMYKMDAEGVEELCKKEKEEVKKNTEELNDLLKELIDLIKKK